MAKARAAADPAVAAVCLLKRELPLPDPWDLGIFLDQVAMRVGKPIRLVAHHGLAGEGFPCGLVIERIDDVVIVHEGNSSSYHADHIVLHEIGHLLLNHGDAAAPRSHADTALALLGDDCDPERVVAVLGRTEYDNEQENQAELFASLVMAESWRVRPTAKLRRLYFRD